MMYRSRCRPAAIVAFTVRLMAMTTPRTFMPGTPVPAPPRRPRRITAATTPARPTPALPDRPRRTARRWARLGLLATLLAVATSVTAGTSPAMADPSTPAPTPSPTAMGPVDNPACGGTVPDDQQRWCVRWTRYTATPPDGAPSHWVTACEQALTIDEQAPCIGVALTLEERPKDGTPTVLSDVPVGTNSAPELVRCDLFGERAAAEPGNAERWNWKRDRCKVMARDVSYTLRPPASSNPPVTTPSDPPATECDTTDVACHISEAIKDGIAGGVRTGIQGLTDAAVQAMAWGLGELAKWIFDATGPSTPDESFFFVYNNAAGLLLVFVLVLFIISVIINGLRIRGPGPATSLGGLVRALLGITFAGGLAFIITQAWDEATAALIDRNSVTTWNPAQWVEAMTALSAGAATTLVALIIAWFSLIGLLLVGIMLLFRGLLATGAALYGAMAMAGQVSEQTQHWGRRWFWTINALASSKFFMAMLWIYGTRGAYQSDLFTALKAMLIIWMMVMAPWVLLRLTSIFDGYISDISARGVLAAAAAGIGNAVGQAAQQGDGQGGGGQGGPGDQAAGVMNTNVADMATAPARQAGHDAGQAAGLTPGTQQQAADAVSTGADGGRSGDPAAAGGPADGSTGSGAADGQSTANGPADRPNAAEADATQGGVQHARHDLGTGQVTAPGDATGAAGSSATDPTGLQGSGGADTGSAGIGSSGAVTADGTAPGSPNAGSDTGASGGAEHSGQAETGASGTGPGGMPGAGSEASGEGPPGAAGSGGPAPGPPDGADGPPAGGSGPPGSSGGAGAAGGGAGGAAAGAADVPIVPV